MKSQLKQILELRDTDWRGGISHQTNSNIGGIFQTAANFDPFEYMGAARPAKAFSDLSTITITPKWLVPFTDGGTDSYVFIYGDRTSGNECLYKYDVTNATMTDISSSIWTNLSSGTTINGEAATYYSGRFIYGGGGFIRKLVVGTSTDSNIGSYTGEITSPFVVGADANLYFGLNSGGVGQVTPSYALNTPVFSGFTSDFSVRDMVNDGIYLVMVGDTNPGVFTSNQSYPTNTKNRCQVQFWDYAKGVADIVWDFEDTYIIGMKYLDGVYYIIGYDNIWACTRTSPPRIIFRFTGNSSINARPAHSGAIDKANGCIYWAANSANSRIYGFGNPLGDPKILFQPYTSSGSSDTCTALAHIGTTFYAATNHPKVTVLNSGSTQSGMTIETTNIDLSNPYQLAFVKVVLDAPLASGESVTSVLHTQNGTGIISDSQTISYSASNPRQSLIFLPSPGTGNPQVPIFEDMSVFVTSSGSTTCPTISRVEVWGYPLDNQMQLS